MTMTNAVKKMSKVGEVKEDRHGYSVENNEQVLTVMYNGRKEDNEVATIHVKPASAEADSMTDYFPGSFFKSMKAAIEYMAM